VTSGTIVTTGNNSAGIYATQFGGSGGGDDAAPAGAAAVIGPNGGISVTSGSITTGGANSHGMDLFSVGGNIEVTSTGNILTSGPGSHGILAVSQASTVAVDANNVSTTGTASSNAIDVTSATGSTVTVRGLVQATNGFEVFATGGATIVNTTASGIIRGAVSLTANADRVNNAGLFDAIGTSAFGAGTDIFTNTGTTRSINGAAVLGALEQFNSSGLVEMRDNAVGDTLNVTGSFTGSGNSHLGVDANISTRLADVLITGISSGSSVLDVNLLGTPVFDTVGTLVVDATAGTSATAFTLGNSATSSPYVRLGLLFDAPNNNFLLVGLPDQPVFESLYTGTAAIDFWYQSADAITAQLEGARDGLVPGGTTQSNLTGDGRWGGWLQVLAGNTERDATQAFNGGGGTTVFDTSYDQDFQGIQAGLDYQSGGAIIGASFGVGRSEVDFDASLNGLDMDGMNAALYAAFNSGNFFVNGLAKVDWIDVDSSPGAGLDTKFDATAWGLRGTMGFRFQSGHAFFEPSASLSWVNVDIDDYVSGGASVSFDDITSFRGQAGLRIGGDFQSGNGTFTPFIGGYVVEEFDGDIRNNFTLGQTIQITDNDPGTFGELVAGLNYHTGRVEAFVRGEYDIGNRDGLSGRAGVRIRF
jgi:hypothetical protein